jgi:dipeptidyl-peptidase-3
LLKASEAEIEQSESSGADDTVPFLQLISQETDVMLSLNRSKVHTVGMPALGEFLTRLQVYKSTADVDSARALFTEFCEVPDSLLALRRIVLVRKKPRPLLVQVTTSLDDSCEEGVRMKDYPETFEGIIESFVERFQEWMLTR